MVKKFFKGWQLSHQHLRNPKIFFFNYHLNAIIMINHKLYTDKEDKKKTFK